MKRIYLLLIHLLASSLAMADYPIVSYRYIADPGAFVHNGRVYVYCSNDDENNDREYLMKSIVCVSSSDLKNWTDHGVVFRVPQNASWAGKSWAPSPAYRDGKFYLYFGNGGSTIGVAVSNNPTGPFVDPLGRPIVTASSPGVQPFNGWLFDPMTFVDDDGQAYMYFGGNGDGNLRVVKLNANMTSLNGSAGRFNVPNFFEAAWMHKHNGTYYFSYSSTPNSGMRIEYMTSNNPMSGFTYRGAVSPQPPQNNNNNHHAHFKLGDQWYQMYHNRTVATQAGINTTYHRNLAIDAFSHRTDGTIVQMVNTTNGVKQVKYLNPYERVEAETMSDQRGIETEVCSAGGMNVFSIDNNDNIMVEGVDFGSAGANKFSARVASTKTGGTIEVRLGSVSGTLVGTLPVPNTGGNQTWRTETISTSKVTGVHNLYFVFKGNSSGLFNFDYWSFSTSGPSVSITSPTEGQAYTTTDIINLSATAATDNGTISNVRFYDGSTLLTTVNASPYTYVWSGASLGEHTIRVVATDNLGNTSEARMKIMVNVPQGPFGGIAHPIPGRIQAEAYDVGGEGIAFHEADANGNQGEATLRNDEVDIEATTDIGGGHNIAFIMDGEWLEYSVDVLTTGNYNLELRVAAEGTGKALHVDIDGKALTGAVDLPNTGGWQTWQTVTLDNLSLTQGKHILRMSFDANYMNLNYIEFKDATLTSLENLDMGKASIYPNPFKETLYAKINGAFGYELLSPAGAVLETGTGVNEIEIASQVSKGLYFLKVIQEGKSHIYKVIKE